MSYSKTDKAKEINLILDRILPEYKRISAAPTHLEQHEIRDERLKLYKSTDAGGNVFLIQNPSAWANYVNSYGVNVKVRPQPIFKLSYEDAQKAGEHDKEDLFKTLRIEKSNQKLIEEF